MDRLFGKWTLMIMGIPSKLLFFKGAVTHTNSVELLEDTIIQFHYNNVT